MAYLSPEFEHDIFLSYSHGFAGDTPLLREWSRELMQDVRDRLKERSEFRPLSFFIDDNPRAGERLSGTDGIHDGLENFVAASAIYLCLMSDYYLESDWCALERQWWHAAQQAPHREPLVGLERRFVCFANPIEEPPHGAEDRLWPQELRVGEGRPRGYRAFHEAPELDQARLGTVYPKEEDVERNKLVIELVRDLRERLREIKGALEAERRRVAQNAKVSGEGGERRVFVHAPAGCQKEFEEAWERLDAADYFVLPEKHEPLPTNGDLDEGQLLQLQATDALLLLAAGDLDASFSAQMSILGRRIPAKVRALDKRTLYPAGVLDPLGAANHSPKRLRNAGKLGLEWIEFTENDAWQETLDGWLQRVAAAEAERPTA